jgi:hypothetical protein
MYHSGSGQSATVSRETREISIMIRPSIYASEYDVLPQAIFWRPLSYFATSSRNDEDGLDGFQATSFVIDNEISFDLRKYRGHPEYTVTVYLSVEIQELSVILEIIELIIQEMAVPKYAVAWKRGWDFEFGSLQRRADDRLTEAEARVLALKIAAQHPNHTATTEIIKQQVPRYIPLSGDDLRPSPTRPREARWQQIVGNVISHQKTLVGPFVKGYAIRTEDGISVTRRGLNYLNNMGFAVE